jgi:STE24 endopeptidase
MIIIEVVISYFGDKFFIFLWIAFVLLIFFLLAIYPIFIAPMFNKFEPLNQDNPKEKELQQKIEVLCKELKFPLDKIFKVDGSKRSNHS